MIISNITSSYPARWFTERDEKMGQTYSKEPVEDQKTVEGTITMLGTLFKELQ